MSILLQYCCFLCRNGSCWSSLQSCSWRLICDTSFFNSRALKTDQPFPSIKGDTWNSLQCYVWSLKPRPWEKPLSDPYKCLAPAVRAGLALLGQTLPSEGHAALVPAAPGASLPPQRQLHFSSEMLCGSHFLRALSCHLKHSECQRALATKSLQKNGCVKAWHEELLASSVQNPALLWEVLLISGQKVLEKRRCYHSLWAISTAQP